MATESNTPYTSYSAPWKSKTIPKPSLSSHRDLPGFEKGSHETWIRYPEDVSQPILASHPRFIILFGWGDVIPKHIRKYTDGYLALFPHTPQIIVTTVILRCLWTTIAARAETMRRIVETVYPPGLTHDDNVLVQSMSNSGSVFYAATTHMYQQLHGCPMPHRLLVLDSSPGNAVWNRPNISVSALAMSPRISKRQHIPLPVAYAQAFTLLCVNHVIEISRGEPFFGYTGYQTLTDDLYVSPDGTRRLYLYGKDDQMVSYKMVDEHIELARDSGAEVDAHMFEGSNHVSHLKHHPEKYWAAINKSWELAGIHQHRDPKRIRANI